MSVDKQPPQPAANDERSELANLKALLLGPEQQSIERLEQETHSPEIHSRRVAETLPESLHKAYDDSPRTLVQALGGPVSECIEDSVHRNPTFFADILYPVMGPAIRRSISQALKGLVQQINQTLEHSLTLKGLKWRIEAARSGVPFAEIVLRNTLRYRVEEAFLIQNGSGLLIQHLSQGPAPAQDADAVSAMLTAIRDFAHDTLDREGEDSKLETVDAGDHTLWLVHGPRAYLACAIRGVPPLGLRDDLQAVVEEIHRRHGGLLETFDGDPAQAASIAPVMEPCLRAEMAEQAGGRRPWPLILILVLLVGMLGWWGYGQWQSGQRGAQRDALRTKAVERLATAPGVVLTDWRIEDGRLLLRGLHDPLTPAPAALLGDTGLTQDDYRLEFRTFQSSEPGAALARAGQRLAPPPDVVLTLDGGTLAASGLASTEWIARARLLATTVPGVERLDDSRLEDRDRRLRRELGEHLQPPEGVEIEVRNGEAELRGMAPLAWIDSLDPTVIQLDGLESLGLDGLSPLEGERLERLATMIEQSTIDFVSGIELGDTQRERIGTLATLLAEAYAHARQLGRPMRLRIIGRTDGTGTPEQNNFVAHERARRVAEALTATEQTLPPFSIAVITQPPDRPQPDVDLRRVEFRLQGLERPAATAPGP